MSNEATYGYTAAEPHLMINKRTYDRISDTDFRKKLWKAPAFCFPRDARRRDVFHRG